jgi:Tol biopolymer transport system component
VTTRTYVNFDLLIEKEVDGSYAALVTGSPVGTASSVRFALPFDGTTLENLLLKLDPGRSGTRRSGASTQQQAAMDFGGPLYDAIFRDEVLLAWSRSQDVAREKAGGLRLRLRLTDAAEIAGLPWELLYDKPNNHFIAQSERTPLVRYLDVPSVPRAITVDGPLRVLAVIASPTDLETLDVEAEWERLNEAMADRVATGSVVLDRLPSPVVAELGPWLRHHQTHVIHFVGHGDFDERLREGVIYFENEHGARAAITSSVLGPFVRDHDPLRMVVLNACRSARTDALDPFGGIAQGLVQQDATAVVAMQFPISDRAAVAFTSDFYGSLVDGLPVDQAVTSARKALLGGFRDEWATPVLFLRAPDGAIFHDVHAVPPPPPPPPPPVPPPDPVSDPLPGSVWRRLAIGAGGAAAVVAVVLALATLDSGDGPGTDSGGGVEEGGEDGARATTVLPVAASPLADDQLLVAAGPQDSQLDLYRVDVEGDRWERVTDGNARWAGASISRKRDTLIFTEKTGDTFRLLVADPSAADQTGDPLFGEPPELCEKSMERPARHPEDPDLIVSPCIGEDGQYRLVELNLATGATRVLDETSDRRVGDPTISPDGDHVVYWSAVRSETETTKPMEGTLFTLELDDPSTTRRALMPDQSRDGDAVFSPLTNTIAFTRSTGDGVPPDRDLFTVSLEQGASARPLLEGDEIDQDPTWSPNGRQLAFRRGPPDGTTRIHVVTLSDNPDAPVAVSTAVPVLTEPINDRFRVEIVPAWSRR